MTLLQPAPTASLSVQMREGSRPQHDAAESSVFVEELMAGRVNEVGYVRYLTDLRAVYAALEDISRRVADDPIAGPIVDSRLDRVAAIDADLAFWSEGPTQFPAAGAAASSYADAIHATAAQPELLVAHHYTRYLGDLSGGQVIGRMLDRHFGLKDGEGTAFYRFEDIEKVKPYKDGYRERLDSLPVTSAQQEAIVTEVQRSFTFNQAIFAELGQDLESYLR